MKKFLLMCFAALLCATNLYAVPGSGTEADPYVVADGDTYNIPAGEKIYIKFSAPSDGTLTLAPVENPWGLYGFVCDGVGLADNITDTGREAQLAVRAGKDYVVYNNGTGWTDTSVKVTFEAGGASAFSIVSSEPAEGSAVAKLDMENTITLTSNVEVGYVTAELRDKGDPDVYYGLSAAVDESDATKIKLFYEWGEVPMYVDHTYEITLKAYGSYDDWLTNVEPVGTAVVTYTGATEAAAVSDVKVVAVSPEPGLTNPTPEQMLSFAEGRTSITVEFSGKVNVQECVIMLGYGTSTDFKSVTTEENAEGHTVVTAELPDSYASEYEVMMSITATDEDGNPLVDEDGAFASFFVGGSYTFDFAIADGRVANASMEAQSVEPADGAYVEALESVALTLSGEAPIVLTSKANAGLYKGDVKVFDVQLTTDVDETGFVTMDNNHVYAKFFEPGTETPAVVSEPGTYVLKIDSMSIADSNFDETAPWKAGYLGIGICNPDWAFTYNVVDVLPEVTDVDPAPYVEGGAYSEALPEQVRITLNVEGATVNAAYLRYGMNTREVAECAVDGNVITVKVSEAARTGNSLAVIVNATAANGAPVVYNDEEGQNIILNYQTPLNILVPVEVVPADKSTVEELSVVTIRVDEAYGMGTFDSEKEILLTDEGGNTVATGSFDYDWNDWNAGVITLSKTVTEDGTYTLTLPEGLFNALNDENVFNPELVYTFTVPGVQPEVVSVDPAPYVEGGEYSTALPEQVNITLNVEDVTVNAAYLRYGMNTREVAEYAVEGNVITVKVSEAARTGSSLAVIVNATTANGTPIAYNDEEGQNIILNYQLPLNTLVPVKVEPADGSTVAELSTIIITVDEAYGMGLLDATKEIVLTDAGGRTVTTATIDYDWNDWNAAIITLNETVAENGTYKLTLPEGLFTANNVEGVCNPELTYTFTVDTSLGIGGVTAGSSDAPVKVYNLNGVLVSSGKAADVLGKLPAGVYIVNGRKVVIR